MARPYASGKHAFGFCDICGFRYPLHDLKAEVSNMEKTGIMACDECWSPDNPQNQLGRHHFDDPQALRNPRPVGAISGRDSNDIVQLFNSSTTIGGSDWNGSGGSGGTATTTIDTNNDWVKVAYSDSYDPQFRTLNFFQPFPASERPIVKVRWFNEGATSTIVDGLTAGIHQFFWANTDQPGFSGDRVLNIPIDPNDLLQMGEDFFEVEFDLSDQAEWSGTINKLRFDFFTGYSSNRVNFDLYIEWIKIQTVPRTNL